MAGHNITVGDIIRHLEKGHHQKITPIMEQDKARRIAHPLVMKLDPERKCIRIKLEDGSWINLRALGGG